MRVLFLYEGIPTCDIRLEVWGEINGTEYDLESRIHFRSSGHGTLRVAIGFDAKIRLNGRVAYGRSRSFVAHAILLTGSRSHV